jgi:N6-adenosine-specific RNA methylase IME4
LTKPSTEQAMSRYSTVVADPPWPYRNPGEFTSGDTPEARGAGSDARYGSMSLYDIAHLPVRDLAADDAHLYLWVTNAFLPHAYDIAQEWGFRPITLCTWVKTTEEPIKIGCKSCESMGCPCHGMAYENCPDKWKDPVHELPIGLVRASGRTGYYFKGATEHCLFAVRGKAQTKWRDPLLTTAWLWPRVGKHSVKPEAFYDLVENVSPGPRVELFARRNRLGWDTWGDQALPHVVMGEGNVVELV